MIHTRRKQMANQKSNFMKMARERADHLKKEIRKNDELYYKHSAPEISDAKYDALVQELKDIEQVYPELITSDSPTQTVGSDLGDLGLGRDNHKVPMLSISNAYNNEDLYDFNHFIKKQLLIPQSVNLEFIIEMKIDGASISLTYEGGKLIKALTRGDGTKGEDVTANALVIEDIPNTIPFKGLIEIRGEIYCSKLHFEKMNKEREAAGQHPFANPRNTASGSLKLLDPEVVKERKLRCFAYAVGECPRDFFTTQEDLIKVYRDWGFKTEPNYVIVSNIDSVPDEIKKLEPLRYALDYDIDGLVIKLNDRTLQERLGTRQKSPKWAVAWKFTTEKKETVLESVEWQVGRTGVVTPVANFKTVLVSGTKVSRATLHNIQEIDSLGLKIGDTILVEKAAEIIPKVVSVNLAMRDGSETGIKIPTHCPCCGYELEKEDSYIKCCNDFCKDQLHRKIEHFASRKAMDIDSLGEKTISLLIEKDLIQDFSSLYSLTYEDILGLDGFKEKSARKLYDSIQKSKRMPLAKFLYALGINGIGETIAADIAAEFETLDACMEATISQLMEISGIGDESSSSFYVYFRDPIVKIMMFDFVTNGLDIMNDTTKKDREARRDDRFADKTFVLTGDLGFMTREAAEREIELRGGRTSGSVSKKTHCVIVGENPGSKSKKAKELCIMVITAETFKEMIGK
jgi:DNA ligase (NAD+)